MKYISTYSDRLSRALKQIDELEEENAKLRDKNRMLRASMISPELRSLTTLTNGGKVYSPGSFAKPTISSRNKALPDSEKNENFHKGKHYITIIDNKEYVYRAGVPTFIRSQQPNAWDILPGFMRKTKASSERESINYREKIERRNRTKRPQPPHQPLDTRPSPSYEPGWGPYHADHIENLLVDLPESIEEKYQGTNSQLSLADSSRLNDYLDFKQKVLINSKIGIGLLRQTSELVQGAIFDVAQKEWPRSQNLHFQDGAHLVRLGRDELMQWIGEYPSQELAVNGYSASTIYHTLLDVVPLRNAISHPNGHELRDAAHLDWLLRLGQDVTVKLGDNNRALKVREIRDVLLSEATSSMKDITDLYYLAVLPFHELVEYQTHHIKMFKNAIGLWEGEHYGSYSEEVLTVGQSYINQRV
ncbi:hypothetical protein F5Y19DRAFT_479518 [Xylariaceae sp. FL1651]|nr:hypothetical protein F5Y19DRAFT_479518 [Xylariaceae sp. FL1651]